MNAKWVQTVLVARNVIMTPLRLTVLHYRALQYHHDSVRRICPKQSDAELKVLPTWGLACVEMLTRLWPCDGTRRHTINWAQRKWEIQNAVTRAWFVSHVWMMSELQRSHNDCDCVLCYLSDEQMFTEGSAWVCVRCWRLSKQLKAESFNPSA
jgi:hypothetical protein